MRRPLRWKQLRRDDGSLMVFTVVVFAALMLLAGVSLDFGAALDAKVRALHVASEAARMGAQQLDMTALHRSDSRVLNPDAAQAAAKKFLVASGATGTVVATSSNVTVHAVARQNTWILSIIGIHDITMTADATASPESVALSP